MNLFERDLSVLNRKIEALKTEILSLKDRRKDLEIEKTKSNMIFFELNNKIKHNEVRIQQVNSSKKHNEQLKKYKMISKFFFWIILVAIVFFSTLYFSNVFLASMLIIIDMTLNCTYQKYCNRKIRKNNKKIRKQSLDNLSKENKHLKRKIYENNLCLEEVIRNIHEIDVDLTKLKNELDKYQFNYQYVYDYYEVVKSSLQDNNSNTINDEYRQNFANLAAKTYLKSNKGV